jgi:hypothetical protein
MFEIWKLRRRKKKAERFFDLRHATARKQNNEREMLVAVREWQTETSTIEAQLGTVMGDRIINEAEKLDVEVPDFSASPEYWINEIDPRRFYLSSKGRSHLRKLIDEEKARRFEVKVRWIKLLVPLIAALVVGLGGIIGGITGLVAVLHKK